MTLSTNVEDGSTVILSLVSLHPTAALSYALEIIASLEGSGVGLVPTTLNFSEYQSDYDFMAVIYR